MLKQAKYIHLLHLLKNGTCILRPKNDCEQKSSKWPCAYRFRCPFELFIVLISNSYDLRKLLLRVDILKVIL